MWLQCQHARSGTRNKAGDTSPRQVEQRKATVTTAKQNLKQPKTKQTAARHAPSLSIKTALLGIVVVAVKEAFVQGSCGQASKQRVTPLVGRCEHPWTRQDRCMRVNTTAPAKKSPSASSTCVRLGGSCLSCCFFFFFLSFFCFLLDFRGDRFFGEEPRRIWHGRQIRTHTHTHA